MLAPVDFSPAVSLGGQAVSAALVNGAAPHSAATAAFDGLLTHDVAMADEGADAPVDAFAQLDAWVAAMLAQVVEAEAPAPNMPALQDGPAAAPWLLQALDQRTAQQAESAEGAALQQVTPAQTALAQTGGQTGVTHGVAQPATNAVMPGAIGAAALPPESSLELMDTTDAGRLFKSAGSANRQAEGAAATQAPAQSAPATPTARAGGEATAPAIALDGLARAGVSTTDVTATQAGHLPRQAALTDNQQKLVDALGERLSVQTHQGMRQAVIRLDPHLNGSVRIELRQDASGIAVHLSATNADVVRQLQVIGESLRQDLGARNSGDVTVQVSASRQGQADADTSGGRERHARDDAPEQGPGRSLVAAGGDGAFEFVSRDAARMQKETL